jgi:uncharacterized protein YpuA (DUF1002 family)
LFNFWYCYIFILAITFDQADAVKTTTKNYNIRFIDEQTNGTSNVCIPSKGNRKIPEEELKGNTQNIKDIPSSLSTKRFLKRNEVIKTQFTNVLIIYPNIKTNPSS